MASNKKAWLLMFYAPWCGHCQALEPEWDETAKLLLGQTNVGRVDITANPRIGRRFGVRSFPTLKYIREGYTYDYESSRDTAHFLDYARGAYMSDVQYRRRTPGWGIITHVTSVKDAYDEWYVEAKEEGDHITVLLCSGFFVLFIWMAIALCRGPRGSQRKKAEAEGVTYKRKKVSKKVD